jgi:hypothetical protein
MLSRRHPVGRAWGLPDASPKPAVRFTTFPIVTSGPNYVSTSQSADSGHLEHAEAPGATTAFVSDRECNATSHFSPRPEGKNAYRVALHRHSKRRSRVRAALLDGLRMRADGGVDSRCLSNLRGRYPAVGIAERVDIIRPQAAHRAFGKIGDLVREAAQDAGSLAFVRIRQGRRRQLRHLGEYRCPRSRNRLGRHLRCLDDGRSDGACFARAVILHAIYFPADFAEGEIQMNPRIRLPYK